MRQHIKTIITCLFGCLVNACSTVTVWDLTDDSYAGAYAVIERHPNRPSPYMFFARNMETGNYDYASGSIDNFLTKAAKQLTVNPGPVQIGFTKVSGHELIYIPELTFKAKSNGRYHITWMCSVKERTN